MVILLVSNLVAQKLVRIGPFHIGGLTLPSFATSGATILFPITYIFGSNSDHFFAATRRQMPDHLSCPSPGGGVALKGITPRFLAANGKRAAK